MQKEIINDMIKQLMLKIAVLENDYDCICPEFFPDFEDQFRMKSEIFRQIELYANELERLSNRFYIIEKKRNALI